MKRDIDEDEMINRCRTITMYQNNHSKLEYLNKINENVRSFIEGRHKSKLHRGSKSIQMDVILDDFINIYQKSGGKCALSGIDLTTINMPHRHGFMSQSRVVRGPIYRREKFNNISFDRIDSRGSYSIDNLQVVCSFINIMKNDMSQETFLGFCRDVTSHNSSD